MIADDALVNFVIPNANCFSDRDGYTAKYIMNFHHFMEGMIMVRGKYKRTPEWRKKISAAQKMRYANMAQEERNALMAKNRNNKKTGETQRGSKRTKEHKDAISNGLKRMWQEADEEKRQRMIEPRQRAGTDAAAKTFETKLEKAIVQNLRNQGYSVVTQKRFGKYRVDIYIQDKNLIVECYGCYWHGCEVCNHNEDWQIKKRRYHENRIRHLESLGHNVKIIWDHEFDPQKEIDIDR